MVNKKSQPLAAKFLDNFHCIKATILNLLQKNLYEAVLSLNIRKSFVCDIETLRKITILFTKIPHCKTCYV